MARDKSLANSLANGIASANRIKDNKFLPNAKDIKTMHARSVCWLLILLGLTGCARSVYHPIVPERQTTASLGAGLAGGAAAIGTPGGLVAGGIIGGYANSKGRIVERIRSYGAQVVTIGDTTSILIPADYYFEAKDDVLKNDTFDENHPLLNLVARYLNKFGNGAIKIAVSTDDIDTSRRDYILAQRQAYRIAAYLYRAGISAWRLYPWSYGKSNLLATNRTITGSYRNRMIEITVNPYVTPLDCCQNIRHFEYKLQPWQAPAYQ